MPERVQLGPARRKQRRERRMTDVDIDAYARFAADVEAERNALQRFKEYVHRRLDEAGIPTHPDGPHSADGCRIGDRLDIALGVIEPAARVYRGLAARIEDAPDDAVPVFDGIASLHDALGKLGSATDQGDGGSTP